MTTMLTAVPFHNDTLLASLADDGEVLVAVKPICTALGLTWASQRLRIMRDVVLSEGVFMMNIPSDGGPQTTLCLPLRLLNGWLFGIDENRVRVDIRDKVIAYKRECYDALWRHFQPSAEAVAAATERLAQADKGAEGSDIADDISYRTMRGWIDLVREARLLRGSRAAMSIWDRSPLPPLIDPGSPHMATAMDGEDCIKYLLSYDISDRWGEITTIGALITRARREQDAGAHHRQALLKYGLRLARASPEMLVKYPEQSRHLTVGAEYLLVANDHGALNRIFSGRGVKWGRGNWVAALKRLDPDRVKSWPKPERFAGPPSRALAIPCDGGWLPAIE